ncbi:MAG: GNAT family N-acetyltransferase, partial [Pseudomonadota bacterium]|nr:GNAT family N-acetyltransferase [Pseudomonadota bacterium]
SLLHCPTIGLCGLIGSLPNYFAAEVAAVYDEDAEMFAAQMVDPVVDYLAALMGFVGLEQPIAALPCAPCVEVGWRLGVAFWGNGYATEAAKAALQYGFGELALDEIVSFTTLANQPSRAVMQRLGMVNADEDLDHPNLPVGHELRRHCLYRLSRRQWSERTQV